MTVNIILEQRSGIVYKKLDKVGRRTKAISQFRNYKTLKTSCKLKGFDDTSNVLSLHYLASLMFSIKRKYIIPMYNLDISETGDFILVKGFKWSKPELE